MRFRTSVGVLTLSAMLTACGSSAAKGFHPSGTAQPADAPGATSLSSASATAPPTSMTTAQVNLSVLDAYRRYQQVYEQTFETGDTSQLSSVAMDPLLSNILKDVSDMKARGEIWRFHNFPNPEIQGLSKDNGTVAVLDCLDTLGAFRFSAATGKQLGPVDAKGGHLYQAIMKYTGGTWKVFSAKQGRSC